MIIKENRIVFKKANLLEIILCHNWSSFILKIDSTYITCPLDLEKLNLQQIRKLKIFIEKHKNELPTLIISHFEECYFQEVEMKR